MVAERSEQEYPRPIEPTPRIQAGQALALRHLREEHHAALSRFDLRRSRTLLLAAAEDGLGLGRVYVDVVRPSLRAVAASAEAGGATQTSRLMLGSVRATLAVLASRPVATAPMRGEGRTALVSVGGEELDELDGQVIMDVLSGDGWTVEPFAPDEDADAVVGRVAAQRAQLIIMPTSRPSDLLRSAAVYTLLRRMSDPPIIVACSFGHPDETARARAAGADAFVNDPDELLRVVDKRLPEGVRRAWGVHMRRFGETLVVTPTGDLDAEGLVRLRAVVDSRVGSFSRLIVDTSDLGSADVLGVQDLLRWLQGSAEAGREHRFVAGDLVRPLLAGLDVDPALLATADDSHR